MRLCHFSYLGLSRTIDRLPFVGRVEVSRGTSSPSEHSLLLTHDTRCPVLDIDSLTTGRSCNLVTSSSVGPSSVSRQERFSIYMINLH